MEYNSESGALDAYNRESSPDYEDDNVISSKAIPTPFVDLPIGATEDRVLGSIDFSATLKKGGKPVFLPGLLASANRGILYMDEVNLLPAHLVDVLLDASASGVNVVQREGLTLEHPAKFIMIGTMNPEEGQLRPQLLDRFGLVCDVFAPRDVLLRASVIRQRMAFEQYPETFSKRLEASEEELSQKIQAARDLLPIMEVPEDFFVLISTICVEFGIASLRADITLYKTALALAAWEGKQVVERDHIKRAAKWALAHRKHQNPFDSPPPPPSNSNTEEEDRMDQILNSPPPKSEGDNDKQNQEENQQQHSEDNHPPESQDNDPESDEMDGDTNQSNGSNTHDEMQTFKGSKPQQIKKLQLKQQHIQGKAGSGKRNTLPNNPSNVGRYARSAPTNKPLDLALDATLRSAAANGLDETTGMPIILPQNWRKKVRHCTTDTLILFVVDASGSMSARQRMEAVKGAVLALLQDAYQQRDRVGVISFRGPKADVLLEATNSVELAEKKLRRLATGGRTPLAHALALAQDTFQQVLLQNPEQAMLLIILSDGKANVPLSTDPSGDAWKQTEQTASSLASLAIPTLFLDTDVGHVRVGRGKELAEILAGDYLILEDLTKDSLVHTIRQVGKA